MKLKRILMLWLPVMIWAGIIFWLSGIPHLKTSLGWGDVVLRKIAHLAEYGILSIFLFRAFEGTISTLSPVNIAWITIFLSLGYAVSDEFHQSFVSGRNGSPIDVSIDFIGSIIAVVWWLRSGRIRFNSMKIPVGLMVVVALVSITGCGSNYHFTMARIYEARGMYARANHHYQAVIETTPHRAAEALYRQGEIFRMDEAYPQAEKLFNKVIKRYKNSKWSALSAISIMNSPDYFPLQEGFSWVEGDSQTLGKNMKIYTTARKLKRKTMITRKYYAGKMLVKELSQKRYFQKLNFELREFKTTQSENYTVILKYPARKGTKWSTKRNGRKYIYRIVDDQANIKVKAQRFNNCIKVSERDVSIQGSVKYIYYAPHIGRVLTTVKASGSSEEYRNSELLSYKKK